jgi:hypothetical protein
MVAGAPHLSPRPPPNTRQSAPAGLGSRSERASEGHYYQSSYGAAAGTTDSSGSRSERGLHDSYGVAGGTTVLSISALEARMARFGTTSNGGYEGAQTPQTTRPRRSRSNSNAHSHDKRGSSPLMRGWSAGEVSGEFGDFDNEMWLPLPPI